MKKVITLCVCAFCLVAIIATASPLSHSIVEPDLTVEMISAVNNNYSQGTSSEIALNWRVKTTQDIPATAQVKLNILISPDANEANGQLILSIVYSGSELKAAQPREDNRTFTNPTGVPLPSLIRNILNGINYAFVKIDVDNQVVETNESNNISNQMLLIIAALIVFQEAWSLGKNGSVVFNSIQLTMPVAKHALVLGFMSPMGTVILKTSKRLFGADKHTPSV
jgi:hypothetical protein